MAIEYKIPTLIIYFVGNGYNRNKLRSNHVSDITYNMYYKILVEPIYELDHVPLIQFIKKKIYFQYITDSDVLLF